MQPDCSVLTERIEIKLPLIGFYDAPDPRPFEPLVTPRERQCVFMFFANWLKGETLHITRKHFGCGGAGRWMCGIEMRPRKDMISFLVDEEGLKESHELMGKWLDARKPYRQIHPHLFIGPLQEGRYEHVKSITFLVNPDQLSTLMIGAQYHSAPDDPPPVVAPFGSGCSGLFPFEYPDIPQAAVGATDIAMRQYLPPDLLAFTVTPPMFERLCSLDSRSFLFKPFLERLKKARGKKEKMIR